VADLTLDKEMLSEVIKKGYEPSRGRETVDFVRTCFRVSIRRAYRAVPAAVDLTFVLFRSVAQTAEEAHRSKV
jgi:hypothetical protein